MTSTPSLVLEPAVAAELIDLFRELDADLERRYGPGDAVRIDADDFVAPGGRLLVARIGGDPVGCAGIRRLAGDTAELKRMYVRPAGRGRGVARLLLAGCEDAALELGYRAIWLETGNAQPEALALYRSAGYRPVPAFGQYAGSDDTVSLGRTLTTGRPRRG